MQSVAAISLLIDIQADPATVASMKAAASFPLFVFGFAGGRSRRLGRPLQVLRELLDGGLHAGGIGGVGRVALCCCRPSIWFPPRRKLALRLGGARRDQRAAQWEE